MPLTAQLSRSRGFTLVELLTVLAIMTILSVLVVSGLQSAFGTAFGSEASDIASTFMRARAYAIANNTYVYVGFTEVNVSTPATTSPQTTGNGRIAVAIYATNDGSRGYDPTTTGATPAAPITLPQTSVAPLRHFENIHRVALSATSITTFSSTSSYPITSITQSTSNSFYDLAVSTGTSGNSTNSQTALTMTWPPGGTAQYTFGGTNAGSIIQFNPQGEAQIFTNSNTDSYYEWIEVDLVPSHGSTVPVSTPNQRSILIDGASGSVSIFRS
jgi:prepilin-type N-terminal cleavage/methylation domain-containing protein